MSALPTELPQQQAARVAGLLRVGKLRSVPGYLPGLRQPVLVAEFHVQGAASASLLDTFMRVMEQACGTLPELEPLPEFARWPVLACVARATLGILQRAGWPLLDKLTVLESKGERVVVAFPTIQLSDKAVPLALHAAMKLLQALGEGAQAPADPAATIQEPLQQLQARAPRGTNSLRFLQAAHAQGIPWKRLAGNIYQFGWGARARWLDSSFTDQTPSLAVDLARDKRAAVSILRNAGIPVPVHRGASNEAEALRIADRLGYPVVVKPADLDGGRGVSAFLETPADVAQAFAAAAALSRNVLVEKHFIGNDYRLQVFRDEVYWAVWRVPAGVTGDGTHSVSELVALANAEPRRAPGAQRFYPIALDAEATRWLTRQGLHLESVPAASNFVRLRGAANVATGGTIEPVLAVAHPDNLALAVRAAAILRLDLAGIDLLIPDITRPWHESGAVICEVNAQPQMSRHLPAELLPRLVKNAGRIPVCVMLGGATDTARNVLCEGLRAARSGTGVAGSDGAWISGQRVATGPLSAFQAGHCVLDDPTATLLALHVDAADVLESGCPVDRIDHLVLHGPLQKAGAADWSLTLALAAWLARMSAKVWLLDGAAQWQPALRQAGVAYAQTDARALLDHIIPTLAE